MRERRHPFNNCLHHKGKYSMYVQIAFHLSLRSVWLTTSSCVSLWLFCFLVGTKSREDRVRDADENQSGVELWGYTHSHMDRQLGHPCTCV